MTAIETEDLTKQFGRTLYAVDGLDLTVEDGEVFGFLGPNGAGKSTTINMLLDFIRPTSGSAQVLGHDAQAETTTIRQQIGVLPEGYDLYPRLSGRSHIEMAIELKGASDDPDAIIDRVGLDPDDADRKAGDYSQGMRQRLALGMAIAGDPELLILDEPTNGLDPNGAREMREIVEEHAERGATVFFSSHILEQVQAVCDRVGILADGQLVAVDTIDGLREEVGSGSTLTLTVDTVPSVDFSDVPGVSNITTQSTAIQASITDPSAKITVIDRVREAGARIEDIETSEASLEELFATYTNQGEQPEVSP
ncbi:ABC transporter ATP-binding protein [Salinibaculum rarum]|uniref:ABC transporter ATP-binding protein n=1 Tax=Salinibaculum rarum TaxID=3058903 RepID=UPI00265DC4CF|nr:ABC transporter ATP-binding protein [Salinibaculum sp. KK48]